jgi:hypothetical protein
MKKLILTTQISLFFLMIVLNHTQKSFILAA